MNLIPTSKCFQGWVALLMFTIVTFAALYTDFNNEGYVYTTTDYWLIVCHAVSIAISAIMCLWYLVACRKGARDGERATDYNKFEFFMAVFLALWWIAGLAFILDGRNGYAVNNLGFIENANAYFGAWACLASVMFILGEIGETHFETSPWRAPKLSLWWILLIGTLAILMASVDIYIAAPCSGTDTELCAKTAVGIASGSIGLFFSLLTIGMVSFVEEKYSRILETVLATLLLLISVINVGVVTSSGGPGAKVGNLFFASWITFLMSLSLFGRCMKDFCGDKPDMGDDGGDDDDEDDTVEVKEAEKTLK
eukprot:CAMPEP_0178901956 /NCGR_PEP_ID=MMETSP0786-20121207/4331_1 /TAXON_ID=186022 /ORGANISM="Thalassionema frauenfeldii, Strain CCMP 1798" /LENGTH=309 /DNA_ID=CAMNT_0020573157 /DNA_START=75 /DNA_END=1001 /DNA_ORIENTATION=+